MTRLILSLVLLGASTVALGENFECSDFFEERPVLVVATISEDGVTGTVTVSGTTSEAEYRVEGFNREWRFGQSRGRRYGYLFEIQPNGEGFYYDLSETDGRKVVPEQRFKCRERSSRR